MKRIYNFSAGPATLPLEVLQEVQAELLDWNDQGASVMEISHRGAAFRALAEQIEADLRELTAMPKNYRVLFIQGGGRGQFSMVPMNLLRGKRTADYVDTGIWSQIAMREASKFCDVNQVASAKSSDYSLIPDPGSWQLNADAAYLHIVENETIGGVEFYHTPQVGDLGHTPLVSDMSSCILSRPIDVSKYGLIYAGAQKNIGPAGMTLVIIREDLIGYAPENTPMIFDYKNHADAQSLFTTPPTFAWYVAGKVFRWLLDMGGLNQIALINQRKADKLYKAIDNSDIYQNNIDPSCRSRMNVVFNMVDPSQTERFLEQAAQQGLCNLKGHKSLGGLRASIYNAMPEVGVDRLVDFMVDFERRS